MKIQCLMFNAKLAKTGSTFILFQCNVRRVMKEAVFFTFMKIQSGLIKNKQKLAQHFYFNVMEEAKLSAIKETEMF